MQRIKFRYLPHTADVKFVAYGKSFKEALENAAKAMLGIMLDIKKIENSSAKPKSIQINESASTKEDLVWFTLQDLLSKIDEKALNAYDFKVTKLEGVKKLKLKGKLFFKEVGKDYHLLEIKAVTPHDLRVEKAKNWKVFVLVDV
ncbi:MAG: archease [Candidatus Micrarchaeia archaeon]|jgi:SHS2 domain-containing protein